MLEIAIVYRVSEIGSSSLAGDPGEDFRNHMHPLVECQMQVCTYMITHRHTVPMYIYIYIDDQ